MNQRISGALAGIGTAVTTLRVALEEETSDGIAFKQAWEFGLLALTVWREARGEGFMGMLAVAWSIRNRATQKRWWGDGWVEVLMKPGQYSANWPPDVNSGLLPQPWDVSWSDALKAAEWAYTGNGNNPVGGATHYYAKSMTSPPAWATAEGSKFVVEVGRHRFYTAN